MKKTYVIILVVLAIISIAVAVIYFTSQADNLPHFLPGYLATSTQKHLKHGIAFTVLAVIFLIGAWMLSGSKKDAEPEQ